MWGGSHAVPQQAYCASTLVIWVAILHNTHVYTTHMLSAILIYPCCNVIDLCLGLLPATSGTAPSELDSYSLG